ncbi:uncharacterized protein LOC129566871 [Sitodiplosis mosellana]|uniref:uncharacterized protein LOC129566871 n=1 Tax=Sitodiplosis mosellana TaxID=263140 RepID=UPI0024451FD1|nr:uncharacterized protein LOC129566871 [Sitodiplosis mosellana]
MVTKLVLLHFLGIFLLITKSNAITVSEANVLQIFGEDHLNDTREIEQNETYVGEMFLKSDENVFVPSDLKPKQNASDANCNQIFRCDSGYNIHVMYHYYNRAFQIVLFILFGIELKLTKVKAVVRYPVSPVIASFCCWIFAPLSCYVIGLLLFTNDVDERMNLFGVSIDLMGVLPNAWTLIAEGNVDLSITITVVNTILACAMQPFWVLTLGKGIMKSDEVAARFEIDYFQFIWNIGCVILPLTIGYLIQNYYPRHKKLTGPLLWWLSLIYIAFNILFTLVIYFLGLVGDYATNAMLFLIAFILTSLGYLTGWFLGFLYKQEYEDCLAIANESVIQSTVLVLTSLPMISQYAWNKISNRLKRP